MATKMLSCRCRRKWCRKVWYPKYLQFPVGEIETQQNCNKVFLELFGYSWLFSLDYGELQVIDTPDASAHGCKREWD